MSCFESEVDNNAIIENSIFFKSYLNQ